MSENGQQIWKIAAIGMALVTTTAVITGIVVANWVGREADRKSAMVPTASPSPGPTGDSSASRSVSTGGETATLSTRNQSPGCWVCTHSPGAAACVDGSHPGGDRRLQSIRGGSSRSA